MFLMSLEARSSIGEAIHSRGVDSLVALFSTKSSDGFVFYATVAEDTLHTSFCQSQTISSLFFRTCSQVGALLCCVELVEAELFSFAFHDKVEGRDTEISHGDQLLGAFGAQPYVFVQESVVFGIDLTTPHGEASFCDAQTMNPLGEMQCERCGSGVCAIDKEPCPFG